MSKTGSNHQRAAEFHDTAAHAHERAAASHSQQDHQAGHEHSRQALEHSQTAYQHTGIVSGRSDEAAQGESEHADIAGLAHRLWLERGSPEGSPEADWFQARRELREKAGRL